MAVVAEVVDGRKIYRPNPSLESGSLLFGTFVLLVMLSIPSVGVLAEYRKTGNISTTWIVIFVALGLLLILALLRSGRRLSHTFIALSSEGIEYSAPNLALKMTWDNIEELRLDDEPVLILRHPVVVHQRHASPRDEVTERQISLAAFDLNPESELAQDLRAYAPHLFTRGS